MNLSIHTPSTIVPRVAFLSAVWAALFACFAAAPAMAGNAVRTVALTGQQAPGTPDGVTFRRPSAPAISAAGRVAFAASLSGSGVDPTNDRGIWSERSGTLALVAREGSQAPGLASGVIFGEILFNTELNAAGVTVFDATLTGSGVDSTNEKSIWSDRSGALSLVARSGNQAPGAPDGVIFNYLGAVGVNAAGQMAILATLTGSGMDDTNDRGIWSEDSGALDLVAREGNRAPGTPAGVNFSLLAHVRLNAAGQMAIEALLSGSGVDSTNDHGIWSEGSGTLALVARTGNQAPACPVE